MTETRSANSEITEAVTAWPGVEAGVGRRGEWAFTVEGRQIGHLHGDRVAHFGFPRDVGAELRARGRAGPPPVTPPPTKVGGGGMEREADVRDGIALRGITY